jgi:rhomboid protease GluP
MDNNYKDYEIKPGSQEVSQPPQQLVRIANEIPNPRPWVTFILIGLCIGVFILQMISTAILGDDYPAMLGVKYNNGILHGQVWRLITPMFLHGSIPHILFNMYALFSLGTAIERYYGHARFLALYMLGGLGGNILSFLLTPNPSLGASTAIFGLIGAQAIFIYQNRFLFGKRAGSMFTNTIIIIVVNLFIGLAPSIDNWGHLGGLIGSLAFAWFAGPLFKIEPDYAATQATGQPTAILVDKHGSNQAWTVGLASLIFMVLCVLLRVLFNLVNF